MANYRVERANYHNPQHGQDIITLLAHYAEDPMGGGSPLSTRVRTTLIERLAQLPQAFSVLCYLADKPVGLANCVEGFSTFHAMPLVNVHDLVVQQQHRGRGIGQLLLAEVERIAREKNCCKLTLEVLQGNEPAKGAYAKFGFDHYTLDPRMGSAVFLQKQLSGLQK